MAASLTRSPGLATGARGIISGSVSNGATWEQDVQITEDGTALTGTPTGWEWRLTVRQSYDQSPVLTLSTATGELTIVQGADYTTLQIRDSDIRSLDGDYLM